MGDEPAASPEEVVVVKPTGVHDPNTARAEIIMKCPMLQSSAMVKGLVLIREFRVEPRMVTPAQETTLVRPTMDVVVAVVKAAVLAALEFVKVTVSTVVGPCHAGTGEQTTEG